MFGGSIDRVYKLPKLSEYPLVYKWLKKEPGNAIAEFPMHSWGGGKATREETLRMLYSLYHGKSLVNGYSGFNPPDYEIMVKLANSDFPSKEIDNRLINMGVDYIVVNGNMYDSNKLHSIKVWYQDKLVKEEDNYYVFHL